MNSDEWTAALVELRPCQACRAWRLPTTSIPATNNTQRVCFIFTSHRSVRFDSGFGFNQGLKTYNVENSASPNSYLIRTLGGGRRFVESTRD